MPRGKHVVGIADALGVGIGGERNKSELHRTVVHYLMEPPRRSTDPMAAPRVRMEESRSPMK